MTRLAVLVLTTGAALLALPSDLMVTGILLVGCVMAAYLMARNDSTDTQAARATNDHAITRNAVCSGASSTRAENCQAPILPN